MLYYTGLVLLVIAVSLDGFGVGVTYGMQKIRMPLLSLFIIMCCSGFIVIISMTIGNVLSQYISPSSTSKIGATILILIGTFSLWNVLRQRKKSEVKTEEDATNVKNSKRSAFSKVITTPNKADLDKSGIISAKESLLLGIALAMDAFGAGLGAAIIGYTPSLTAILIAIMSGTFVYVGMKIGLFLSKSKKLQRMGYLPPLLLIALGIFNMT